MNSTVHSIRRNWKQQNERKRERKNERNKNHITSGRIRWMMTVHESAPYHTKSKKKK